MSDSILKTVAKTSNDIPVEKSQDMSEKEEKNDDVDDDACISNSVLIETSQAYEKMKDCGDDVMSACNEDVDDSVLIEASQKMKDCDLTNACNENVDDGIIDNDDCGVADDILIKASQEYEERRVSSGIWCTSDKLKAGRGMGFRHTG